MKCIKRSLAITLGIMLILALSACGSARSSGSSENSKDALSENNGSGKDPSEEVSSEKGDTDTVVVYFSATGTTKAVAEKIAGQAGADLKEIVPAERYTSADLNYNDRESRATKEQNDPNARPAIVGNISLGGYKTVYLGYPIWWGKAPKVLFTFVESCDFSGITVIPFCTSGSSDIGQSDDALAAQAGSGNWLQGKRFSGRVAESELRQWIEETKPNEETQSMEKTLSLKINDTEVVVNWENNGSVDALKELVSASPLTVQMSMYGGFEQVGSLGASLPRDDKQTTAEAGDIMLYSGDRIVIFYGSNPWSYTRLGKIADRSASDMAALLGNGNVKVTITYGGK